MEEDKIETIKKPQKEIYLDGGNVLKRVSNKFNEKLMWIDKKRLELGLSKLSCPKKTELIIRHKPCWKGIENDLINYDAKLEKKLNDKQD